MRIMLWLCIFIVMSLISAGSVHSKIVIVAIGDSDVYGDTRPTVLGHKNTIFGGWVTRLTMRLELDFPGEYEVINKGISGDTAQGVFNRLERDVVFFQPGIVIMLFGSNDADEVTVVAPPARTAYDFRIMMDKIFNYLEGKLPKTSIFIMGLLPPLEKYMKLAGYDKLIQIKPQDVIDSRYEEYNRALKDVTVEHGNFFIDYWAQWPHDIEGRWEFLSDGTHHNDAGYDKRTDILYAVLCSTVSVEPVGKLTVTWGQIRNR